MDWPQIVCDQLWSGVIDVAQSLGLITAVADCVPDNFEPNAVIAFSDDGGEVFSFSSNSSVGSLVVTATLSSDDDLAIRTAFPVATADVLSVGDDSLEVVGIFAGEVVVQILPWPVLRGDSPITAADLDAATSRVVTPASAMGFGSAIGSPVPRTTDGPRAVGTLVSSGNIVAIGPDGMPSLHAVESVGDGTWLDAARLDGEIRLFQAFLLGECSELVAVDPDTFATVAIWQITVTGSCNGKVFSVGPTTYWLSKELLVTLPSDGGEITSGETVDGFTTILPLGDQVFLGGSGGGFLLDADGSRRTCNGIEGTKAGVVTEDGLFFLVGEMLRVIDPASACG